MRTLLAAALAIMVGAGAASAQSGSTYDWRTGNSYHYRTDSFGNTRVQGNNLGTGSSWTTNIKPNGSMSGFDSNGNYWNYSGSSGMYQNFGTGQTCVGTGLARSCY